LCQHTKRRDFALQSADCSHLKKKKKKKTKKKNKNVLGARAFARFSSSLVFFFSVSFATTPGKSAEEEEQRIV